jgi:hypothetical protein
MQQAPWGRWQSPRKWRDRRHAAAVAKAGGCRDIPLHAGRDGCQSAWLPLDSHRHIHSNPRGVCRSRVSASPSHALSRAMSDWVPQYRPVRSPSRLHMALSHRPPLLHSASASRALSHRPPPPASHVIPNSECQGTVGAVGAVGEATVELRTGGGGVAQGGMRSNGDVLHGGRGPGARSAFSRAPAQARLLGRCEPGDISTGTPLVKQMRSTLGRHHSSIYPFAPLPP